MYYRSVEKGGKQRTDSSPDPQGAIFWHLPNKPTPLEKLPLSKLTDIFLGKQTPRHVHWKQRKEGQAFKQSRCFSLYSSEGQELDLVAPSDDLLRVWTQGLQHVLASSRGNELIKVSPNQARRRGGGGGRQKANKIQVGIDGLSREHLEVLVNRMKRGAEFWLWTVKRTRRSSEIEGLNDLQRTKIRLRLRTRKLESAAGSGSGSNCGYFTWENVTDSSSREEDEKIEAGSMDLDALSSIFIGGANTSLFRTARQAAPVSNGSTILQSPVSKHCWSLVADDGLQLNLEAFSEQEMLNWVKGLRFFLQTSGPGLQVEEVPDSPGKERTPLDETYGLTIRDPPVGDAAFTPRAEDSLRLLERGNIYI